MQTLTETVRAGAERARRHADGMPEMEARAIRAMGALLDRAAAILDAPGSTPEERRVAAAHAVTALYRAAGYTPNRRVRDDLQAVGSRVRTLAAQAAVAAA